MKSMKKEYSIITRKILIIIMLSIIWGDVWSTNISGTYSNTTFSEKITITKGNSCTFEGKVTCNYNMTVEGTLTIKGNLTCKNITIANGGSIIVDGGTINCTNLYVYGQTKIDGGTINCEQLVNNEQMSGTKTVTLNNNASLSTTKGISNVNLSANNSTINIGTGYKNDKDLTLTLTNSSMVVGGNMTNDGKITLNNSSMSIKGESKNSEGKLENSGTITMSNNSTLITKGNLTNNNNNNNIEFNKSSISIGGSVTNNGTLNVKNESSMTIGGNLVNSKTLSVSGNSIISTGGNLTNGSSQGKNSNSVTITISNDNNKIIPYSNIHVGSNATNYGTINLNGGSLYVGTYQRDEKGEFKYDDYGRIVQDGTGDFTNESNSKVVFQENNSYLIANNLTQEKQSVISVGNSNNGAQPPQQPNNITANIIVYDTYTDNTNSNDNGNNNSYPWEITKQKQKNKNTWEYKENSKVNLYVGVEYIYRTDASKTGKVGRKIGERGRRDNLEAQHEYSLGPIGHSKNNKEDITNKSQNYSSLLPITLTSFFVEQNDTEIVATWTTSCEVNNDFYTIEYSLDGITFTELGMVAGAGTSSEEHSYLYEMPIEDVSGLYYFRLKQTDFNGDYSYSEVVALWVKSLNEVYIYPNPTTDLLYVSSSFKTAKVYDTFGKYLLAVSNSNSVDVSTLSVGTYLLVLDNKTTLTFIKK